MRRISSEESIIEEAKAMSSYENFSQKNWEDESYDGPSDRNAARTTIMFNGKFN